CLFKTPLRFIGALLVGIAIILMIRSPQPDVLIAADGSAVAVRGENGRLSMIKSGNDVFAFREWLAADADARAPKDAGGGDQVRRGKSASCATAQLSPSPRQSKHSRKIAAARCWW